MIEILADNNSGYDVISHEEVARAAILRALAYESINTAEVSLLFVNNQQMQELNLEYRGKETPTDVLSFPQNDGYLLGDIVINIDRVIEQANEYGHSVKREVAFLTVHSVLHLLGFDHCDEMFEKQELILSEMGLQR